MCGSIPHIEVGVTFISTLVVNSTILMHYLSEVLIAVVVAIVVNALCTKVHVSGEFFSAT